MRCATVQTKLEGYLAGTLDGRTRDFLDRHLGSCASCQAEMAKARRVWQSLESDERLDPGPGFNRRVWARIDTTALPAGERLLPRLRPTLALTGATAVAVLLGGVTGREIGRAGDPAARGARVVAEWPVEMLDRVPPDSVGGTYSQLVADTGGDVR
jgi:anti-sigma factor RsiW